MYKQNLDLGFDCLLLGDRNPGRIDRNWGLDGSISLFSSNLGFSVRAFNRRIKDGNFVNHRSILITHQQERSYGFTIFFLTLGFCRGS